MYGKSAHLYDTIYLNMGKDYAAESSKILALNEQYSKTRENTLLDVACGTGLHAGYLREYFRVEGLDIDEGMLAVAREKHPDIPFHHGDMLNFDLHKEFDIITCLFSAIGYMGNTTQLNQAVATMGRHLKPGGVLLIEPWFSPNAWHSGSVHAAFVDKPEMKIARMNISENKGNTSFFNFHFLVGTPNGIEHFTEYHELTLFTHDEYMNSFRTNGLDVFHDTEGLYGRGLYISMKPTA